ncbi:DEKNAAC104029 [Brettanomyces naardenensis]|uniref:DEKNAAC104029 n=1 Tax=Brettanomyces naardenensis TaxID=13370 RepID=A0A448YQC4_BRENA|nr:DEKNAAC104029 [Brettanomyces naardenensis]
MSNSDSDWFDDDDVNFDEVFSKAAEAASRSQSNMPHAIIEDPSVAPLATDKLSQTTSNRGLAGDLIDSEGESATIMTLKGENAILRAQLRQISDRQEDEQKSLRARYLALIEERDRKIAALDDSVGKFKEENEFLTSENKTLSSKYIGGTRKKRRLEAANGPTVRSQASVPSQVSDSTSLPSSAVTSSPKIAIVNQATIFQDEKMLFIESISSQGILGMSLSIFGYLSKISASFSYQFKDFQVGNQGESIKTAIVNYLIGFENKNRIDMLLSDFIEILLDFILRSLIIHRENNKGDEDEERADINRNATNDGDVTMEEYGNGNIDEDSDDDKEVAGNSISKDVASDEEYYYEKDLPGPRSHISYTGKINDGAVLLPLPYLLSLVHFALNYRPMAINIKVLERTLKQIRIILMMFPDILKQDLFYLSLDREPSITESSAVHQDEDATDFKMEEKTMHVKILEVFTVCYSMDILETLSKLASFSKSFSGDDSELSLFWRIIPKKIIMNTLLSTKTPAIFVHNMVEILISSITDNKFAFWHVTSKDDDTRRHRREVTTIFNHLITLLDEGGLDPDVHIKIYGLIRAIGPNSYIKLLEILTPTEGLSESPVTHSSDDYRSILFPKNPSDNIRMEYLILKIKLKILQLFELHLSYDRGGEIRVKVLSHLISAMVSLLGKQQEIILRAPRAKNIPLRMELISTIVRLIHFLLSPEGSVEMKVLQTVTVREMIIALVRISADSLKNSSVEYITKLRLLDGFKYHIFNESFERHLLDTLGFIDEVDFNEGERFRTERTAVEVVNSNGLEINYDDETIDMARDVLGQCITGYEADNLHYSINYDGTSEQQGYE